MSWLGVAVYLERVDAGLRQRFDPKGIGDILNRITF